MPSLAWLVCLAAYLLRPWSCGFALGRFSPDDAVPFANFDRHGFMTMIGLAVALLFAPFVMVLVARVLFADQPSSPAAARPCRAVFLWSAGIALVVALPTYVQTAFMIRLPIAIAWPVWASAVLWCVVVALVWRRFIRRPDADLLAQKLRRPAQAIAALTLFPKLALWIWASTA
ncbi:hypothetical protein [Sphingomonas jinjuensis]|uniref:hypothetical protein n=1 Tax=Sphingomonas jinjuensis TaxID=535907 RepID=UPI001C84625F|nr:hypothetical protein [Sphingomonas jinjuensis]